jgi:nucleotide-binding universal stress UspA family protein
VAGNGLEVHVILASGDPRRMIVEAVEKNSPDIVVIARKEKNKLESVFSKSVSAYLIKNAGCHLMVMGPV